MKREACSMTATAILLLSSLAGCAPAEETVSEEDPYLWLEEVDGERALDWVREQNAATAARLEAHPEFESLRSQALAALNSASAAWFRGPSSRRAGRPPASAPIRA